MIKPQLIWNLYSWYVHIFRLYIIALLVLSLFMVTPSIYSINYTVNGYHLAIFELQFYVIMLLLYNLRPSRFKPVILKAYEEKSPPPYNQKSFFWVIYLLTLLIIFGVPLLLCFGYIRWMLEEVMLSNEYIIEHAGAWIPAGLLLMLGCLMLWTDTRHSLDQARFLVGRTLYILMITVALGSALCLLLVVCRLQYDLILIFCLAFNVALIWTDWKIYLKTRAIR